MVALCSLPIHSVLFSGETDILDIQNIRRLRDSGYLESIGVLLPKSMWVEAGFDRAVSPQTLCGKKRNSENGDGDDAEEDERGVALANDIDRYSEVKRLRRQSRATKLRRAKKAKRAEARRKGHVQSVCDTYLPIMRSYLASSRSAGEKEAWQSSGKERAQAALDLERSRAADMREKSVTARQKALGTYKELYSRERRRLVEEKNADVPDAPFIKAIECFLAQLRSDMDANA